MSQKKLKKLRRAARLMADLKAAELGKGKPAALPVTQTHYRHGHETRNNPLTERGTYRWLKRHAK